MLGPTSLLIEKLDASISKILYMQMLWISSQSQTHFIQGKCIFHPHAICLWTSVWVNSCQGVGWVRWTFEIVTIYFFFIVQSNLGLLPHVRPGCINLFKWCIRRHETVDHSPSNWIPVALNRWWIAYRQTSGYLWPTTRSNEIIIWMWWKLGSCCTPLHLSCPNHTNVFIRFQSLKLLENMSPMIKTHILQYTWLLHRNSWD